MGMLKYIADKLYSNDVEVATVESGDGYVKFGDGTLICYGNVDITITSSGANNRFGDASGTIKIGADSVTFPQTFFSSPIVTAVSNGSSNGGGVMPTISTKDTTLTGVSIDVAYYTETAIISANWQAIGRWK